MADLSEPQQHQQQAQLARQQQQLLKVAAPFESLTPPLNPSVQILKDRLVQNLLDAGFIVHEGVRGGGYKRTSRAVDRLVSVEASGSAVFLTAHLRDGAAPSFMLQSISSSSRGEFFLGRHRLSGSGPMEVEPCYVAVDQSPRILTSDLPPEILSALNEAFAEHT